MPRRATAAQTVLEGNSLTRSPLDAAVTRVQAEIKTQSDMHATPDYRRQLIGALAQRTLLRAAKNGTAKELIQWTSERSI